MPVLCPSCTQPIPPEDVNVAKDVAFCRSCNNAFSLSGQVVGQPGNSLPPRMEQPAGSRVLFTFDGQRAAAVLPALGFHGTGCFFVIFSAFWNFVTWTVFLAFLGSMLSSPPPPAEAGGVPPPSSNSDFQPWMFLFFIPHMTIGLVTALIALYCIKGDVAIAMDKTTVLLQRRLFGYNWSRSMPFDAITDIRLSEAYKRNRQSVYGVSFQFEGSHRITQAPDSVAAAKSALAARPMVFGSGLSEGEKNWLLGEFYAAWRGMKS